METEIPEPAILAVILEDARRLVAKQDKRLRETLINGFISEDSVLRQIPTHCT